MILMQANPLLEPLEGGGSEISTFLDTMGTHFVRYHFMVGPETHVHNDFDASKSIT